MVIFFVSYCHQYRNYNVHPWVDRGGAPYIMPDYNIYPYSATFLKESMGEGAHALMHPPPPPPEYLCHLLSLISIIPVSRNFWWHGTDSDDDPHVGHHGNLAHSLRRVRRLRSRQDPPSRSLHQPHMDAGHLPGKTKEWMKGHSSVASCLVLGGQDPEMYRQKN